MTHKAALAALLAALCLHAATPVGAQSAAAQFLTGNDLLQYCVGNNVFNQGLCSGYVIGVADNAAIVLPGTPPIFCVPAGASVRQLTDVALAYLQKTPELRHLQAHDLVGVALHQAFPCGR